MWVTTPCRRAVTFRNLESDPSGPSSARPLLRRASTPLLAVARCCPGATTTANRSGLTYRGRSRSSRRPRSAGPPAVAPLGWGGRNRRPRTAARARPHGELRPSGRDYARAVRPAVPLGALVIGVRVWANSGSLVLALAVVAATVGVGRRVRPPVRPGCALVGGRARHLPPRNHRPQALVGRDQVASVLLATQFTAGRTGPAVLLVLRDRSGRPLLRLSGPIWDTHQVEGFVSAARLGPVTRVDVPTDAAYMRRHQPRPWAGPRSARSWWC